MVAWIAIFSLIAIWFIAGLKICRTKDTREEQKEEGITYKELQEIENTRNREYYKFLKSEKWKKIEEVASSRHGDEFF